MSGIIKWAELGMVIVALVAENAWPQEKSQNMKAVTKLKVIYLCHSRSILGGLINDLVEYSHFRANPFCVYQYTLFVFEGRHE